MQSIYGNSMPLLQKSLDYLWMKETVTSNNIANAETPGYQAQYVTFEETFQQQLDAALRTNDTSYIQQTIVSGDPQFGVAEAVGTRNDENSVNVDAEMIELTRSALQYQYALSSFNGELSRLSAVIKGQ